MCDVDPATGVCRMDGAADLPCKPLSSPEPCPAKPQFTFVDNSTGILNPYLALATQYGWANYMFQTNQGPGFPAHQFLFSGTSAQTALDDAHSVFAGTDVNTNTSGCIASLDAKVGLITPQGLTGSYLSLLLSPHDGRLGLHLEVLRRGRSTATIAGLHRWRSPTSVSRPARAVSARGLTG